MEPVPYGGGLAGGGEAGKVLGPPSPLDQVILPERRGPVPQAAIRHVEALSQPSYTNQHQVDETQNEDPAPEPDHPPKDGNRFIALQEP